MLEILVCPVCKGPLAYDRSRREVACRVDRLAFPIINDIPVMLVDEARELTAEEAEQLKGWTPTSRS